MNYSERCLENWKENSNKYGAIEWEKDPDFLYYIQANIPLDIGMQLIEIREKFMQDNQIRGGERVDVSNLHVTLALPGRLGTHFQKNDVSYMKSTLKNVFKEAAPLPLRFEGINIFSSVLWAQVFDLSNRLQSIHETICNEIPFSEHPDYRYQNYLPHASLLYGGSGDLQLAVRDFPALECLIDTIEFGRVKDETVSDKFREVIETYQLG